MTTNQDDIASQLLGSRDARIAAAAARVFSSTVTFSSSSEVVNHLQTSIKTPSSITSNSYYDGPSSLYNAGSAYNCNPTSTTPPLHDDGTEQITTINNNEEQNNISNDDELENGKKPSSTERLKRR